MTTKRTRVGPANRYPVGIGAALLLCLVRLTLAEEPAAAVPPVTAPPARPANSTDELRAKAPGAGEQLEFLQAKVAAEMAELEQRMFRLAETLKSLEPENASRLMLGLKFAREELILHQMQQIQEQLRRSKLDQSVGEQKVLLTKLQRLEELLLSTDLDFQMRLERLRQIREILRRLDGVIREEEREQKASTETAGQQRRAEELRRETEAADSQEALQRLLKQLSAERFAALAKDQQGNRQSTDGLMEMVRSLGSSGTGALGELNKAGGNMSRAADDLQQSQAGAAEEQQQSALEALRYARQQLAEEAAKLQEQLRGEVKKRVLEGLVLMLEQQVSVREATTALGPQLAKGSRQAEAAVVALAQSEKRIAAVASELITLVEETEFGIALPAALAAVRDEMLAVEELLGRSEAGPEVIAAQRQIEEDLASLLEAMKQMPSAGGKPGKSKSPPDQERELNRIVAELKMLRLLEQRLNKETVAVDRQQTVDKDRPATLRKRIDDLAGRQDHVRDVTERLATERLGEDFEEPAP